MSANRSEFSNLCDALWEQGVAGFCPTTLSTDPKTLADTVSRLGEYIRDPIHSASKLSAQPIGIHLEGPFINTTCCGAHPANAIRKLDFEELERLWTRSLETLKILTVASELMSGEELKKLGRWAKSRNIALSLGHSKASESEARQAFRAGFRGITHAWNALGFHQRSPGPLGAALGNRAAYVELIVDQVHVAPTLIQWTQKLHPPDRICFISDCVPAAGTSGQETYGFGPLMIRYQDGACRLATGPLTGALAGGGKILTRSFCEWIESQGETPTALRTALRRALPSITQAPLWALQTQASRFANYRVEWTLSDSGRLQVSPIDSH
jgi:N-acetylglucosamine-6-phosphate deacetylase